MCHLCPTVEHHRQAETVRPRRSMLKLLGTSPLWLGGLATIQPALAQPKPENVLTPDEAIKRLMAGNERYVNNESRKNDFASYRQALTTAQNPYACVLSCADARVSPEFCFDEARGDLFVNRLAGNYVNTDMIANIEYGVAVLNATLIMVLGHSDCGAIKASIKASKEGTDFPGHIQVITTALRPAVKAGENQKGDLLDAVTRANIRLSVESLRQATPIIKKLVEQKKVMVAGGLYHLETGRVELLL